MGGSPSSNWRISGGPRAHAGNREAFEANIESSQNNFAYLGYVIEYMNHTVATAKALGLTFLDHWALPDENGRSVDDQYRKFRSEVDHYTVQIQIAHVRQGPKNTVALDPGEKKHLRAYAEHIKSIIENSNLLPSKKGLLFDKINAFIKELDRDRTPL